MNIHYMREYVALGDNLNFTSTADQMFITQSALSRHIAYVEKSIGRQLFVRSTHSVSLTPIGRDVYQSFKGILALYDDLLHRMETMSNGAIGNLKLGILYYGVGDYVNPVMRRFMSLYPGIDTTVYSYQVHNVVNDLKNKKIDIGLLMHTKALPSNKYFFHTVGREKLLAIVPDSHPFAKKRIVTLHEISTQRLIVLSNEPTYSECFSELLNKHHAMPQETVPVGQLDTMFVTMESTNSIAIGPEMLRHVPQSGFSFIDIDEPGFYFDICYVYRLDNTNPAIPLFIKCTLNDQIDTMG